MMLYIEESMQIARDELVRRLVDMQYTRNDIDFCRGTFRVRGDVLDIFPAYEDERVIRVELFGDFIDAIFEVNPLTGKILRKLRRSAIYPGSHYVVPEHQLSKA
ncbi:excinuclease ABC subunit B, partial [Arthrospira platensis SPKY1]|nr:excinuclease ABC subunit B [Arthrospira platensis SPKY1]